MNKNINSVISVFCLCLMTTSLLLNPGELAASCKYAQSPEAIELPIGIMITWTTSKEADNKWFIVEKSSNGLHYVALGKVNGSGTTATKKDYHYLDVQPMSEQLFYRIKQIDYDGSFSFTDAVIVENARLQNIRIAKLDVPFVTQEFDLTLQARVKSPISLYLLDWKEEVLFEHYQNMLVGLNEISVPAKHLIPGVYKVVIRSQEELIAELLIKRIKTDDAPIYLQAYGGKEGNNYR